MIDILENKLIENNFITKIAESLMAVYIYIYINKIGFFRYIK